MILINIVIWPGVYYPNYIRIQTRWQWSELSLTGNDQHQHATFHILAPKPYGQ